MDTTSINDLPGDNIEMKIEENQDMNKMISSVQQASQGGVISLPSRDIPNDTESNVIIDPEVKQNYIQEPPVDYIKNIETNEELLNNIKKEEKAELKRIELYDLKKDPFEINNVVDQSNYNSLKKDLYQHLKLLQKEMGDTLNLDNYFKDKFE